MRLLFVMPAISRPISDVSRYSAWTYSRRV